MEFSRFQTGDEGHMQDDLSKLLTDLRIAIYDSLSSDDVMAAVAAIEASGHPISVALDVTLNEGHKQLLELSENAERIHAENISFTHTDTLFLRSLRIAS
jgi:hypothetical protein